VGSSGPQTVAQGSKRRRERPDRWAEVLRHLLRVQQVRNVEEGKQGESVHPVSYPRRHGLCILPGQLMPCRIPHHLQKKNSMVGIEQKDCPFYCRESETGVAGQQQRL
jgi:hypothetical protein